MLRLSVTKKNMYPVILEVLSSLSCSFYDRYHVGSWAGVSFLMRLRVMVHFQVLDGGTDEVSFLSREGQYSYPKLNNFGILIYEHPELVINFPVV